MRLSIGDPMSAAEFFYCEMALFFEHFVNIGGPSIFRHIGQYFGAVETNQRGALYFHGLLWLDGNLGLQAALEAARREGNVSGDEHSTFRVASRDAILEYIDSIFCEVKGGS